MIAHLRETRSNRYTLNVLSAILDACGVDWEAAGLRGPSSTWTYLVSD